MFRMTREFVMQVLVCGASLLLLLFAVPDVGDIGRPLGRPHTLFSVGIVYLVLAVLILYSAYGILKSLRLGGGILRSKCSAEALTPENQTVLLGPYDLDERSAIWYRIANICGKGEIAKLEVLLTSETQPPSEHGRASSEATHDVAWTACDMVEGVLRPRTLPGRYSVLVRRVEGTHDVERASITAGVTFAMAKP